MLQQIFMLTSLTDEFEEYQFQKTGKFHNCTYPPLLFSEYVHFCLKLTTQYLFKLSTVLMNRPSFSSGSRFQLLTGKCLPIETWNERKRNVSRTKQTFIKRFFEVLSELARQIHKRKVSHINIRRKTF